MFHRRDAEDAKKLFLCLAGRSRQTQSLLPRGYKAHIAYLGRQRSGTMDLVFKEKDGWVIADYKTDISFAMPKLHLNQRPRRLYLSLNAWFVSTKVLLGMTN
jgi:ATP-dependent exoDNAse (exonuclease V) beta subunit